MTDPNTGGNTESAVPATAAPTGANPSATSNQANMVPITALHEERDKRQAMAVELENLKAQVASLSVTHNTPPISAPSQNRDVAAELEMMWREEPRKAMQAELMLALNWQSQVTAAVEDQFESMQSKYKDFGEYSPEVRRYLNKIPLEQRAKPGIVEAAFFMAKGQKADTLIKSESEKMLQKLKEGVAVTNVAPNASSGGGSTNNASLTQEEKAAAAALGIAESEYIKYRK